MVTFDNTWEKKLLPYFGSIFGRIKKNEAILFVTGLDHKIPNFAKLWEKWRFNSGHFYIFVKTKSSFEKDKIKWIYFLKVIS